MTTWQTLPARELRAGDTIRRDLGHGPEQARVENVRLTDTAAYLRLGEHGTTVLRSMALGETCEVAR